MNTNNLDQFESSKRFYRSLKTHSGLRWASSNFLDEKLENRHNALEVWEHVSAFVRNFRIMRTLLIAFTFIGLSYLSSSFLKMIDNSSLNKHAQGEGFSGEFFTVILILSYLLPIFNIPFAILWICRWGVPTSDALLDAWVAKHWTTHDFEKTLLMVDRVDNLQGVLRVNSIESFPDWMTANGEEQRDRTVPRHVVETVEREISRLAQRITEGKVKEPETDKAYLKNLLAAAKRIRLISATKDIRDYYRKPAPETAAA